jgi:beta-lactamase superfamily II metal-dependent hydrolase
MLRKVATGWYLLLIVALLVATVSVYRDIFAAPVLTLSVLEAGEGSAILVQSPSGERYLINAGKDAGILRELGAALPFWERHIDAVILTAAVASATGGLPDVIRRYRVPVFVRTPAQGSRAQETLIENATRDIPVTVLQRGERVILGGGAYADVLWPPSVAREMKTADAPLVLLLSYGTTTVLIQSDLPPRIGAWLDSTNGTVPTLTIASTTAVGTYRSDGRAVRKIK